MIKIIAECCQNHGGNYDLLKAMVESAVKSGATHVKMQTIFANNVTFRPQFEEGLEFMGSRLAIKRPYLNEVKRLKSLEINWDKHSKFIDVVKSFGVVPLTTCFTHDTLDKISQIGFREIKIASYDCGSHPLIKRLKSKFDHIYVSTGASFDDEIKITAEILAHDSFSLLHCITKYPLEPIDANLNRIHFLQSLCKNVGYSDHSDHDNTRSMAMMVAIYLGAKVVEAHFTTKEKSSTKDGKVSVNPYQLKKIADFSKLSKEDQLLILDNEYHDWKVTLGSERRQLSTDELMNRSYYRGRFSSPRSAYLDPYFQANIMNWEQWTA